MLNILMSATGDPGAGKNPENKGFTLFNADFGSMWAHGKWTTVSTVYVGVFLCYVLFVLALMGFGIESTTWLKPQDVRIFFYMIVGFLPIVLFYEGKIRLMEVKQKIESQATGNKRNRK
jgi:hypothetical protein